MYLKSLTLKGFKSFAQPTTFVFEPGVTCVVGPNGSGKSNVVDALAWVMGEQGAKTLRGGKMEDVIFAGTATKGPLGRAEVILTIDNSDGALPIEYTEVTISRTLFRNGGSEYAINGEQCRLLDVQELLSDSGLGREMHVIVGQGQLDQVLHANPEDRRGFIEEAAGILKHRRRKEKTLRKLEAMQANLTRLSDLAGELRRQLKPLGQQAEVARAAATIQADVRDAKARLLADEVVTLRAQIDDVTRNEHERKTERIVLQEQLDQALMRAKRIESEQSSDAVDDARRIAYQLESVQERLRGLYNLAGQRIALLSSSSENTATITTSQDSVDAAKAEAERLQAQVADAERAVGAAASESALAKAALDALDEEIAAQSALVSRHDLELASLAAKLDVARSKLAATRGEHLRLENALAGATERRDAAAAELEAADTGESDEGSAAELEAAYRAAEDLVAQLGTQLDTLRESQHVDERERDSLAARASALALAIDAKDGSGALVAAGLDGILGLVAEHVKVEPGAEAAVAAALGTLADAVLAKDRAAALEAVAYAREHDLGMVEIVIAEPTGTAGATSVPGIQSAPRGVIGLIAAASVDDAGTVVTDFVVRGGSGRKRSRLELVAERETAESKLTEVATRIEQTAGEIEALKAQLDAAKRESGEALTKLREHDSQVAARSERLGALRKQAESAVAEAERLATSLAAAADAVNAAEAAATSAEAEHEAFAAKPRPMLDASQRDDMVAELESKRQAEVQARIELETIRERVRSERARADELERQLARERQAADDAARIAVIRRRQLAEAQAVSERLPAVLDSVDRSVAEARLALAEAEAGRAKQNEELSALRTQEASLRERLGRLSESVHGLEMQVYEKKLHLSSLIERAADELALDEQSLVAEYGPDVPIPTGEDDEPQAFDRAQQQQRLAQAEKRLAQLGRVNPLALEEFAALEQRHKFLQEQLADLQATRTDLLTIIGELDERMQDIFRSAFEDTKAAFAQVFPVLFPGGTGSISLTSDDMLTAGIEVSVRPAGKKIERLSLLSGGERSLAAVALLIAIFKARPSPFYVMDEVEAALDDANLGRLLEVMTDLRESSQLIVITHQKRTMEIADALYGVSMRQDGVSAVVGQRVGGNDG